MLEIEYKQNDVERNAKTLGVSLHSYRIKTGQPWNCSNKIDRYIICVDILLAYNIIKHNSYFLVKQNGLA